MANKPHLVVIRDKDFRTSDTLLESIAGPDRQGLTRVEDVPEAYLFVDTAVVNHIFQIAGSQDANAFLWFVGIKIKIRSEHHRTWVKTRDFNALPSWHPEVEESHIENKEPSDKVGCIRNFRLKDGSKIREKLLALTDIENLCTYSILESPMEVENYVATMRFLPITDGNQTYAEWTAEFNCPPREEEGLIELISGAVFQGGFDALKQSFAV